MDTVDARRRCLIPYNPPSWTQKLLFTPKYRVELAVKDTVIHDWALPGLPHGFQVHIKRDDLTGSTLSGNKVRKLEFFMAEAIEQGCSHVITCGRLQSNHCRSVTVAATELGLKTHLVQRSETMVPTSAGVCGNAFLNRICGANIYLVPMGTLYEPYLKPRMDALANWISDSTGEKSYLIPTGGSGVLGIYGYFEGFNEMIRQGVLDNYDDIVVACASAGTAEGLAIANYLNGSKLRIHGFGVVNMKEDEFYDDIDTTLRLLDLDGEVRSRHIIDMVDRYVGDGYPYSNIQEQEFLQQVAVCTGIILDPVYTGKAVRGLVQELRKHPNRFQGKRILFVNTGSYDNYDGLMDEFVRSSASCNKITTFDKWLTENSPTCLS